MAKGGFTPGKKGVNPFAKGKSDKMAMGEKPMKGSGKAKGGKAAGKGNPFGKK